MKNSIKAMEKDNLTRTEIAILFMVRREPLKATELAEKIGISASTLTGVVDRLVERGYVKRIRDENDRRVTFIVPGDLLIEKANLAHEKVLDIMKNSEVLMPDSWWSELSENLMVLEKIFEEAEKELRETEDEQN
ncbi:MAG: MarR family transcriptional regulator [Proteocatella sp.]